MQNARTLGNRIQQLAEAKDVSIHELSVLLGWDDNQTKRLLAGRAYASFDGISRVAKRLGVSVRDLLAGDPEHYERAVACSMGAFDRPENREQILDLIDDYLDVLEAVNHAETEGRCDNSL